MANIFADIKTPYVNELTLKRNLVPKVKENIFQGIVLRPNEACTEKFSTDTDAAELQIIRVKPNDKEARGIGADVNGGYFNDEDATQPNSAAYGIKILTTVDYNIDIPTNAQDMVNVDLAEAELTNLSGKVNRDINAMTLGAQVVKNFNDVASSTIDKNWIEITKASATGADWKNAIIAACAKLNEGNESEGIDIYPTEERAIIIRPSVEAELLKTGALIIGGSNYAQDMLAEGVVSHGAQKSDATGFRGYILGVPVYVGNPSIWKLAEKFAGLDEGALDSVYCLVVAAIGTGRALAFNSTMKSIPSPKGQGIRLQPKYRMGAECWDGLSVVPVVETNYTNPAKASGTGNGQLVLLAPASKKYCTVTVTVTDSGSEVEGATLSFTDSRMRTKTVEVGDGVYTFKVQRGTIVTGTASKSSKSGNISLSATDTNAETKSVSVAIS